MMGQPVHRFLEEFAGDEGHTASVVHSLRPRIVNRIAAPDPIAAQLQEAYERGREDGATALRAETEARIAELAADAEIQIEATRSAFAQTVAERLARDLQAGLAHTGAVISEHVAAVLLPLLRDRLAEAAVREFAAELRVMVEDSGAIAVDLSGPDELVHRLLRLLSAADTWKLEIRRAPGTDAELRVVLADTVIETRLADWLGRIEAAVR